MYDNIDVSLSLMDLKVIVDSLNKFKENIPPTHPCSIEYIGDLSTYLRNKHDSEDRIVNG
jgi:hypothetical protein